MRNNTALSLLIVALSIAVSRGSAGDVLRISNPAVFKRLSRNAVYFPHERHYSWGIGCLDCHHRYVAGVNVLAENELLPGAASVKCASCHSSPRNLERSYHRMCINCHSDMKKRGTGYGPVMCGQCHSGKES